MKIFFFKYLMLFSEIIKRFVLINFQNDAIQKFFLIYFNLLEQREKKITISNICH